MTTSAEFTRRRLLALGLAGLPVLLTANRLESAWAATAAKQSSPFPPPLYGDPKARKRFAMWGNYTCPFTAELTPVLLKIVDDNPTKVSLEWHHFPVRPPDPALLVAGLAFKGKHFWNFTTDLLAIVYKAGGDYHGLTEDKLVEFAKAEGGSEETLKAAYADPKKWQAVKDDFLAGKLLGVVKTPGLFYDGFFLTPGGLPMDVKGFDKSLRNMVAKA